VGFYPVDAFPRPQQIAGWTHEAMTIGHSARKTAHLQKTSEPSDLFSISEK